MTFQNVKSKEDLLLSFKIVDSYIDMRSSVFQEYNTKINFDNNHSVPNYDDNIKEMRVKMRAENYLNNPDKKDKNSSITGKPINKDIMNIEKLAIAQRKANVLQMIKHNDFFCPFPSNRIDVFEKGYKTADLQEQIQILICSEEDINTRWMLHDYWQKEKKKNNFDPEAFIDDLLSNNCIVP